MPTHKTRLHYPESPFSHSVTMQAQKEAPADMQCKDKFMVQCAVANEGTSVKDIPANLNWDDRDGSKRFGYDGGLTEAFWMTFYVCWARGRTIC